jgi:hypothetical protein
MYTAIMPGTSAHMYILAVGEDNITRTTDSI